MKVINKTRWRTDHLKAILQRAAEQEFDDPARRKRLRVTVTYTRSGGCSGEAYCHSNVSTVRIENPDRTVRVDIPCDSDDPRRRMCRTFPVDGQPRTEYFRPGGRKKIGEITGEKLTDLKLQFASVACHEFAHNRGMKHRAMPNYYFWRSRWKEYVAWAAEMPLELKPERSKPTSEEKRDGKLVNAQARWALAQTRLKRAATIEKKWRLRVRSLERRQAATRKEPADHGVQD